MPDKIVLESSQVEILAGRDTLVIQEESVIEAGDILRIDDIEVEVVKAVPLDNFGRFNWEVEFKSESRHELRERLTYIVPKAS